MVEIHWKTKKLNVLDKKKVRDFIKSYDTNGLTMIFTDDYRQRFRVGNTFKKYARSNSSGLFFQGNYFLYGFGGVNNITTPLIVVKMTEHWYTTFLHEFGHYIDWKTNNWLSKKKEKFAIDFAKHHAKNV